MFFESNTDTICPNVTLEIDNCSFTGNILNASRADSGVAINIFTYLVNKVQIFTFPYYIVNITKSKFFENKLPTQSPDLTAGGATVYVSQQRRETFISDSSFINNSITAISAFRSTIVFGGNVTIRNNSGLDGGGLVICQSSYILFAPNTTVTFEENKAALSGGGIYAEDQCLQSEPLCFYQVYSSNNSMIHIEKNSIINSIHVVMINNIAKYAGSQIFGGSMDQCSTTFDRSSTWVYNKIFNESLWKWKQADSSHVTSFPRHICFCHKHSEKNCSKKSIDKLIYPGEPFNVSLVAVGQFNHPVPATIVANTSGKESYYHNTIKAKCTNITLRVYSKQNKSKNEIINVFIESKNGGLAGSELRWINVNYRNCPLGTVQKGSSCYWSTSLSYYNATYRSDYSKTRFKMDWLLQCFQ